jgi:hypothetical protein
MNPSRTIPPTPFCSRVTPATLEASVLERSGALTPYATETIADDALCVGPGARLDVSVPSSASDAVVREVRTRLAWLLRRGIIVRVWRDPQLRDALGRMSEGGKQIGSS